MQRGCGVFNDLNRTSAGWCLRDHAGNFVVADTYWNEGKCSITEGESIALVKAMEECGIEGSLMLFLKQIRRA
jgi:hypothetical protein